MTAAEANQRFPAERAYRMLSANQTIGPYTLIRTLGEGAFGVVWLAERRGIITTQVALKIPRDSSEEILEEVTQEAQVWQKASGHPNVLPVIEAAIYDGLVVIVSEYVAEGTLETWLAAGGGKAPTPQEAITILSGILAGLEHLHKQGIIHRDLKPANIMIQGGTPRLTDFGMSRFSRVMGQTSHITGTLHYMAPEMFSGNYSAQTDIWAAGVLLYEMLSGTLPFPQDRLEQLIPAIVSSNPVPLPSSQPESLKQIVTRALQKEPSDRFASVSEMRAALLKPFEQVHPPRPAARAFTPPDAADSQGRIAILYKRHAQPDGQVVDMLEAALRQQGFEVFLDRHLSVGIEWAREIERQVSGARAVIPILSASSMNSEMLSYEVKIAQEAAQKQDGRPRLLPVRVQYTGPLAGEIADILDPIQYTLWNDATDNDRLVEELIASLRTAEPSRTPPASLPLESVGGAMNLDSRFWIVRPTEGLFRTALTRRDSIVLLKGARQMGKTSLLARGLQQAREAGMLCIRTDFQKLNAGDLESPDTLFQTLAEMIADQLDLDFDPEKSWNARRSANVNFERFLRREILNTQEKPVLWALDEVDRLFSYPFGSEVFGLFRSWHNERSLDPSGPWGKLTLAIAYATEAHLFITDVNQSPFNVGTRLSLEDFTREQVQELNQRYGAPLKTTVEMDGFFQLLGGQPYLSQRGLNEMASQQLSFAAFADQADRDEGIFSDHLRRSLVLLARDTDLCDAIRALLNKQPFTNSEAFYRLRSAGILTGASIMDARPRCGLYAAYLKRHLL